MVLGSLHRGHPGRTTEAEISAIGMLGGPRHRGCPGRVMRQGAGYILESQYVLQSVQRVPWWNGRNAGQGFWGPPHRGHFDRVAESKAGMRKDVLEDSVLGVY